MMVAICVASLGSIIFADAQLPALPSGRHLSLIEGRSLIESEVVRGANDGELLSVGGSVWPWRRRVRERRR